MLLLGTARPAGRPESSSDRQIESAVHDSYVFHTILQDRVAANMLEGRLTLTGTVLEEEDRALAIDTATSIRGVSGLDLRMTLAAPAKTPEDARIARQLLRRLQTQRGFVPARLSIVVTKEIVTLCGHVPDAEQSRRVEALADGIPGVRAVRNELVIAAETTPGSSSDDRIDDASITALVNFALRRDGQTAGLHAQGIVHSGAVTLIGGPGTTSQKAAATALVEQVHGVRSVLNRIEPL